MKTCTKCKEQKSFDGFSKDHSKRDGFCTHCKSCSSMARKRWKIEHPEYDSLKSRLWYDANREAVKAPRRAYRRLNADARREYNRRWRLQNPELARSQSQDHRARRRGCVGSHTAREWDAIISKQRGRCAECKHKVSLERDHIIPLSRGGTNFAFNIQGLCRQCNASKYNSIASGSGPSLFDRQR